MKLRASSGTLLLAFLALGAPAWAGGAKVQVCHVPPGNPSNFHTITISDNALQAHLAHGDLVGPCSAHCSQLCDDGNPCTIDACDASEHCAATHPPVNCDDGNRCTIDSCNPATGCVSTPLTCTDANLCTVDSCDPLTGQCVFPAVSCPTGQTCNPANGLCAGGDACNPNPCVHGTCAPVSSCISAFCLPAGGNFTCTCEAGFTGDLCEIPDPCAGVVCPDNCHSDGVCTNGVCNQGTPFPNGATCRGGRPMLDRCIDGICNPY